MEQLTLLLQVINSFSPIGIVALLAVVIFMLVKGRTAADTKLEKVASNHLHDLPSIAANMEKTVDILQRIEVDMSKEFSYIRTKLNDKR